MDDHRFTGLPGGLQVQAEGCLLQLGGFRLVVIVQTGFTDRHHFRVIELMQQPVQCRRRARLHIQWVHTDRAIDVVIALGQGLDVGSVVGTHADAQEMPDPTLAGRIKCSIQRAIMGGEVEAIKMTMGIYEHKKTATYIV